MAEHDSVIPAGSTGKLIAKIKTTAVQSGPISKSISVTTDAVGAERLMLSVKFTAVSAIMVLPRAQVTLSGIEGDEISNTLVIRRSDGEALEITGIDNHDDRILITTKTVEKAMKVGRQQAKPGDVLLKIAGAPGLVAVTSNGRFRFATNHPDAANVMVNYAIRLRPVIEVRPSQVRLLLQEGNDPARTMLMRIQHNRQGEFKITGVTSSKPELFGAQLVGEDVRQQVQTVAVRLEDEVQPGDVASRLLENLVVHTDDKVKPRIEVSVLIEPRTMRRPAQSRPSE